MALKKLASAGRFGARYGRKIKQRIINVEKIQRKKHKCPFCSKPAVKRIASGIWFCKGCDIKFAGKAYEPSIKPEIKQIQVSEQSNSKEDIATKGSIAIAKEGRE